MRNFPKRALLSVGLALAVATCAYAAPSLLELPASQTIRAQQSVLLFITLADKRLVAVGEQGIVLLSDDNGVHWRQAKVPVSVALTSVRFTSATQGWAVGHGGVVLSTSDGGETWSKRLDGSQAAQIELAAAKSAASSQAATSQTQRVLEEAERLVADGPDKPLLDVHFSDAERGIVVGAYGLAFETRDGGKTWQSLRSRIDNPGGRHLYSIQAAGQVLLIAGEQGVLYLSTDGGASFNVVKTPYNGSYFGSLVGADGVFLVYGLRGNVYRSVDRGASWQKVDVGMPVTLTAGTRLQDKSLVLVDETGRVLRSRDGGQTFRPVAVPSPSSFTGVTQALDGSLVLSGARGISLIPSKSVTAEH